jgi:uncharacterized protein (DUF924 family)
MTISPASLVDFWLQAGPSCWFARDDAFDATLRERFEAAHFAAARRELDHWMQDAGGALALVLLLDQLPRNLFRGSAHAYATDGLGLLHADAAIASGFDHHVDPALRLFFYLPFEHSEDAADQARAVQLVTPLEPVYLDYAIAHRDVIAQFGRFPHRNAALGRVTTEAEQAWLDAGGGF